jgi:glycerol kinase
VKVNSPAILAIDQGTTGTRAIIYAREGRVLGSAYREIRQYYPKPAWVEHDAEEIWHSTLAVIRKAISSAGLQSSQIAAIGITNQRETVVLWDRRTGRPVAPAIVWQDRRTSHLCEKLKKKRIERIFRSRTGLLLDPYFSGTKIHWLLENIRGLKRRISEGQILAGTIDTWLLWKLTGGRVHATDVTNASRTLLFNIRTLRWDRQLLEILKIPRELLPKVFPSGSVFGYTADGDVLRGGIPITAMMGDQQAALFGQGCYRRGEAKNTYGTGCFMMVHVGRKYQDPPFGLLCTLACDENGRPAYALEGSIFIAGALIQWLRDGLKFFKRASETSKIAESVADSCGVVIIPALTGLGSPYWNPNVRGGISGLTRGTKREHIVRAALESIAHQTADVFEKIETESHFTIKRLRVDGGATANKFLMQFQADLLGIPVLVSDLAESTAWGVAKLAAKVIGIWPNIRKIDQTRSFVRYRPMWSTSKARSSRSLWKREIHKLLS